MAKRKTKPKRINLALQGGGAHGAFTWGVLDRILDDDRLEIAAMSGTSAGALNGAAVKAGMLRGGKQGARENLDWLWGEIGARDDPGYRLWMQSNAPGPIARAMEYSPAYMMIDAWSRLSTPYALGPLYKHPLRAIVEQFAFDKVCATDGPKLAICATNVRSGKIKIFTRGEISTDSILASGCLPTIFQAVEIEHPETGVTDAYWDGGYMGNPALFPLYEDDLPDDVIVVNINPLHREEIPRSPQEIQNRINEISFNGSLLRELRAIEFVQRLIVAGKIEKGAMKKVLVHMIADDCLMRELSVATKTVPNPVILKMLKEAGQRAADEFLNDHFDKIGKTSSVDLPAMFV